MSLIRWRNLGRALGILPNDHLIRSEWADLLGSEMAAVEPFLCMHGTAAVVHRRDAQGLRTTWRVVRHQKTDLVGVDDESGERIDLRFEDVQLWSIDWPKVIAALRSGVGLTGTVRPIPHAVLTWDLGRLALTDQRTAPVVLCGAPRHHLAATFDRLAAEGLAGGVVLIGDPSVAPPDAVARLAARQLLVIGLGDTVALDERRRLVGVAGPESLVGDLRVLLGLATIDRPAYQFVRTGNRWDLAFAGQALCVDDQKGFHYLCLLVDRPEVPIEAQVLVATVAGVDRHLLNGSKGMVTDRQSREEVMAEIRIIAARVERLEDGHPDRDRLEAQQDQLMEALQAGDGLGGQDRVLTTSAQAGRAVGTAINRALAALTDQGAPGKAMAAHLKQHVLHRTGHRPVYRPSVALPWIVAR